MSYTHWNGSYYQTSDFGSKVTEPQSFTYGPFLKAIILEFYATPYLSIPSVSSIKHVSTSEFLERSRKLFLSLNSLNRVSQIWSNLTFYNCTYFPIAVLSVFLWTNSYCTIVWCHMIKVISGSSHDSEV